MTTAEANTQSKSLQELEGVDWGDPDTAETPMIGRILSLRRRPLRDLSNGEVRLAVSQRVGLQYLLELALQRLSADPLLEGDYYPGDILAALIRVDHKEWEDRPKLRAELASLFRQALERPAHETEWLRESLQLPLSQNDAN